MKKKRTPAVPMVYVRCSTCGGTGIRPGRSVLELAKMKAAVIADCYVSELKCATCGGNGKEKRKRSDFDTRTAAELEEV